MRTGVDDLTYARIAEWNFCRTFEDLWRRIKDDPLQADRFDLLGIAPIIRKLLLDGTPLLHAAKTRRNSKESFRMLPFPYTSDECLEIVKERFPGQAVGANWRLFSPGDLVPRAPDEGELMTLKEFSNSTVGFIAGHAVSTRYLVKFYCEVEGGVHIGRGRDSVAIELLKTVPAELVTPVFGILHSPIITLPFLGIIVINGVKNLYEEIMASPLDEDHRGLDVRNVAQSLPLSPRSSLDDTPSKGKGDDRE